MKNRKNIAIAFAVTIVLIAGVGLFLFSNSKNSNAGLDDTVKNESGKIGTANLDSEKVLVVYFSETGNTQALAETIYDKVGGDFRRIEPSAPYPQGDALFDHTKEEADNDERPEFKDLAIELDDYETIFVGYPIWWYTLPMMMYTFFDAYDFSDKTLIPFITHNGSGDGGTYETIEELEPEAELLEGLVIRGSDMSEDQTSAVEEWLEELGL